MSKDSKPTLLSGGNPQIAKGYGDAPVQAYIAAVPGWKQAIVRRVDALIEQAVPGVAKAVKWNSPLYAAPGQPPDHWFLSYHCFDAYLKIAFHRGAELEPPPPVASKQANIRYYHVGEDGIDEAAFTAWVRQAAALPHEKM